MNHMYIVLQCINAVVKHNITNNITLYIINVQSLTNECCWCAH